MADQSPLYTATCREHDLHPISEMYVRAAIEWLRARPGILAQAIRSGR